MGVLLLRCDQAGDTIKTLPVLRALKTTHEIHLIATVHNQSLLEVEPGIQLYVLPQGWRDLDKKVLFQKLFGPKSFDVAVNLLCDPDQAVLDLLDVAPARQNFSVSRNIVLSTTPAGRDETINITEIVAKALGLPRLLETVDVNNCVPHLVEADFAEATKALGTKEGRWIGVCPFASSHQRRYPKSTWPKLLTRMRRSDPNAFFFVFGAPSDAEILSWIKLKFKGDDRVTVHIPSSFRTLGAYLKCMDGVIAVESGPVHLSKALGIPTLALFGGGDVRRWLREPSSLDRVLRRGILGKFPGVSSIHRAYRGWISGLSTNSLHL